MESVCTVVQTTHRSFNNAQIGKDIPINYRTQSENVVGHPILVSLQFRKAWAIRLAAIVLGQVATSNTGMPNESPGHSLWHSIKSVGPTQYNSNQLYEQTSPLPNHINSARPSQSHWY
jgi:hypothetical protein